MPVARSPRQRARDGVPSAPLLPWSCSCERGDARLSGPPCAGQGGQWQQEGRSPSGLQPRDAGEARMLQLQGTSCTPGALLRPPPPLLQTTPVSETEKSQLCDGQWVGRGRGGCEDSAWSAAPVRLPIHTPPPPPRGDFMGNSFLKFFVLKIKQ